jgi:hypothetical protein
MKPGDFIEVNDSNTKIIDEFASQHKFIYKFVPLERMLEVLQKKEIAFANPIKWTDPFDNFMFKSFISGTSSNLLSSLYCMCLTLNPHSEAYWKTYAKDNYTARLKFDTAALISFIKSKMD